MKKSRLVCACFFRANRTGLLRRVHRFLGAAFLLVCFPLFPQSGTGRGVQKVPHVTGIRAENRSNLVRLSWTDSPTLRGPVYIFRSRRPFDRLNPLDRMRPVEVPYGVQSYIDEVEEAGAWHYLVSASLPGGGRTDVALPLVNAISIEVENPQLYSFADERPPAEIRPLPPPAPTGVSSLEAAVRGDGVHITFREHGEGGLVLFRGTGPIRESQDLANAVIIENGVTSPFTDYPVPGIGYYYALVGEAEFLGERRMEITPGRNATITPVEIPVGTRVGLRNSPDIRPMPLPLISVNAVSTRGGVMESRETLPLSPQAEAASRDIARVHSGGNAARRVYKSPRAFSQDLNNSSGGGEDYMLSRIVRGSFLARDWETARTELNRYLGLPRSPSPEGRARFYLGQANYYLGDFRAALFEFLSVEKTHPIEAGEWIQAALSMLVP
jgi:hypothetical protein